jgi:hypothetical protein
MNVRKIINKAIRHQTEGVNAAGDVNAVLAANVGEKESGTAVSSRRSTRIVQRSSRTTISDSTTDPQEGGSR